MKLTPQLRAGVLAIVCALAIPAFAAEPAWVTKSNGNAQLLLKVMAKYSPESASSLGVDGFDEQITDYSRDLFEAQNRDLRAAIAEMERRRKLEADPKVRQDLDILISSASDQLRSSALQRKYFFPFNDVTQTIYSVLNQTLDPRIPKARQATLLARLQKYAGQAPGYRPATILANERLQERLKAQKNLLGPYKDEVEQSLNNAPTLIAGMKQLLAKSDIKGWEPVFAALEKQLTAYNESVRAQILPRARLDHRLPPEVYADNLRQFGVDIAPLELKARALTSFSVIRNQMNITAGLIARERKLPQADYRFVMAELIKQQI
ncbi:MAG: hypothetical protein JWP59_3422, partial [Massilia sp.]|nr:hypothetical protein [Massilia sp.]